MKINSDEFATPFDLYQLDFVFMRPNCACAGIMAPTLSVLKGGRDGNKNVRRGIDCGVLAEQCAGDRAGSGTENGGPRGRHLPELPRRLRRELHDDEARPGGQPERPRLPDLPRRS